MSRGMVSFLAGFGSGALKYKQKQLDDERQARRDKQTDDLHNAQMERIGQEKSDRQALKDAAAPVAVEQPNDVLKDDDGNDMPAVPAFRAGTKRFETMADATQAAEAANTPDAANARMAQALRATGKPGEAMQLEAGARQSKAADLQLKEAERAAGQRAFAQGASEAMAKGDWAEFAKFATEQYKDGFTYTAVPDAKGGAVLKRVGADGKEGGSHTFASREDAIVMAATRADPLKYAEYVTGRKDKEQAQANNDREFDLRKQESESNQDYRKRMLGIQGAQEARARQTHALAMDDAKIPPAVKLRAQSLAKQMETVNSAVSKAMAENSFDPSSANAKSLLEQQAALGLQYADLLKPFTPGGKGSPGAGLPDASVFAPAPAGGAAAPGAPAPAGGALPNANGAAGVPVRPGAPVATVAPMQAATAPAAPVVPQAAPRMTLAQVLAGPSADPTLQKLAGDRAQQIEAAAGELRQAQAGVASAAQRGDQKAVAAAMQAASAASARLNAFTQGMNAQQAAQVRAAVGI